MNKNELGRMLDMVDEKYIAEMSDTTVRMQPVKRRISPWPWVSAAAVICLALGISLADGDIPIEEGQGVTCDGETISEEIISTDIIPGESNEVMTGEASYEGLFEYPLDIGRYSRTMELWDRQYTYGAAVSGGLLGDSISFPGDEDFSPFVYTVFDKGGNFLWADIRAVHEGSGRTYDISVSDCGDMYYAYGKPYERYGENVYSFYCERTDGLELWAYFEREGRQYLVYTFGLERETAGAVLDSLLMSRVDIDRFTEENASIAYSSVPLGEAADLPGFDWVYTGSLGSAYLRDDTVRYEVNYDGKGNIDGSSLSVVYTADGEEFAVIYETGIAANLPPYPTLPDISDITPEQLDELCSRGERTVTAGGNVITVTGSCPREALEILFDNIKAP